MSNFYPTPENLFGDTMGDLYLRSRFGGSQYDAVQAAGLMRRLLVDGQPLWALVNRNTELQTSFVVSDISIHREREGARYRGVSHAGPFLDPELSRLGVVNHPLITGHVRTELLGEWERVTQTKTVKQLLAFSVGRLEEPDHSFRVIDLLNLYANKLGGVHVQNPAKELGPIGDWARDDEPAARESVAALGRVVYRGLLPLLVRLQWGDRILGLAFD